MEPCPGFLRLSYGESLSPLPCRCTRRDNKIALSRGLLQLCYKSSRAVDAGGDRVLSCFCTVEDQPLVCPKMLSSPNITVVFHLYVAIVTLARRRLTQGQVGCYDDAVRSSYLLRALTPAGEGIAYRRGGRNWKKTVDKVDLACQIRGYLKGEAPKQHPYRR